MNMRYRFTTLTLTWKICLNSLLEVLSWTKRRTESFKGKARYLLCCDATKLRARIRSCIDQTKLT